MFKDLDMFDIFIGILLALMTATVFILIMVSFYYAKDNRRIRNICYEMPYNEYKKDERCKKLLED